MNYTTRINRQIAKRMFAIVVVLSCFVTLGIGRQRNAPSTATPRTFPTPQAAADALIDAAEKFDLPALEQIFGPDGKDIIHTGEPARDKEMAKQFAEQARKKMNVSVDPKTK